MRVTGGLMVADTDAGMRALRDKIMLEHANGLFVELLDAVELRALAPYLGEGFLGGSYCPSEGMANSLASLSAIADAAEAGGARFLSRTTVRGIAEVGAAWEARTDHGTIRCRNLVIAAGCWSDTLAAMAGVSLPISNRAIHVSVTEPSAPLIHHLCYHADLRLTLKQVVNGNIVIGGGWSAAIDPVLDRPVVLRESSHVKPLGRPACGTCGRKPQPDSGLGGPQRLHPRRPSDTGRSARAAWPSPRHMQHIRLYARAALRATRR